MQRDALRRTGTIALALVGLVGIATCNRDKAGDRTTLRDPNEQDRAGTATLTGASFVSNESAIDRMVAARCAREVTCSNLGPDKHFATGDKCVREVRERLVADMKPSECPRGIDGAALDECLDATRNESCTNTLDTVERLVQCSAAQLCMR